MKVYEVEYIIRDGDAEYAFFATRELAYESIKKTCQANSNLDPDKDFRVTEVHIHERVFSL